MAASDRSADAASVDRTTTVRPVGELAAFLGGFAAAEGSFNRTKRKFRFAIHLGSSDGAVCELWAATLGVGSVHTYARRMKHYDDETVFAVQSLSALVKTIVPFMDAHLPASHKREQYLRWRRELLSYWEHDAKRKRPCIVEGCKRPRRAKRLCRHHYYVRYRR